MNGSTAAPGLLDAMAVIAEPMRARLLLVLDRQELTVGELCDVLQLPQSTVSRHLKALADQNLCSWRAEGTSRRYRARPDAWPTPMRRLWHVVREQVSETAAAAQDAHRLRAVLSRRRMRSEEFFSASASQWDRLRDELFGTRADLLALPALLDAEWVLADLGCGTGRVAEVLAPSVRSVIAVDSSAAMLNAARKRLAGLPNVELRRGELEALPIGDGELHAATLFLVLHYVMEPENVLRECARALRCGGRIAILDMMPHDREEYRQAMGHVWQGFDEETVKQWLTDAGFDRVRYRPLPADPDVAGPGLFVASAVRL